MSVSVAMAVYNGEKYIREQIDSILLQLAQDDELVISYDKSKDNTYEIIKEFCKKDKRIRVINGYNNGVISNFENAIKECRNDYIFLSDQDDIWIKDKISTVIEVFRNPEISLVIHDAIVVDERLNEIYSSFFDLRKCKAGIIKNIIKNSYIGCCMAFRNCLKNLILPFPSTIPMHDQWIGIVAEKNGNVKFIKNKLILYRRHENNLSSTNHAGTITMINWRYNLIKEYIRRCKGG